MLPDPPCTWEWRGRGTYHCPESIFTVLYIRLQVLIKRGRFIEYGVFGKETSADWTIISNAKGNSYSSVHGEEELGETVG
jgi:hypothetical protein